MDIDSIKIDFSEESLVLLNVILAFIMLGVAIDIRPKDFAWVLKRPRGPLIGLVCQFLLLPAFTYFLTIILEPAPSIALGMMLVAACPGGNISNIMTHLGRGNTALSVAMTGISTALAILMTPLNIAFWGSLNPETSELLRAVELDPFQVFETVVIILGIPLVVGMLIAHYLPKVATAARKPMRIFAFVFFIVFVGIALGKNWATFLDYVGLVMIAVFIHNALALSLGYGASRLFGLEPRDSRAVSIETGIQNSGLGLILIFDFFAELGGMALVAAWWGIWHIISGLCIATFWSYRARKETPPPQPEAT